jgi:hypothetical protein
MDAALAQLVSAAVAVLCFDWALAALMLLVLLLVCVWVLALHHAGPWQYQHL